MEKRELEAGGIKTTEISDGDLLSITHYLCVCWCRYTTKKTFIVKIKVF